MPQGPKQEEQRVGALRPDDLSAVSQRQSLAQESYLSQGAPARRLNASMGVATVVGYVSEWALPMGASFAGLMATMVIVRICVGREKGFLIATATQAFLHALIVSPIAVRALFELYSSSSAISCDAPSSILTNPIPDAGHLACAITCGYFISDTTVMLAFPTTYQREWGKGSAYYIMLMHHIVSLLVWPTSMSHRAGAFFVVYFLSTEVTNIGQNAFMLADRTGSSATLPIGVTWMLSFFVVRILPIPLLLYMYAMNLRSDCPMPLWIRGTAAITLPVPLALNAYWFSKMVAKAMRRAARTKGA